MGINVKKCPACHSLNVIRMIYGMPEYELFQEAEDDKVKLGGCCIDESVPDYHCKACGYEWNRQDAIDHAYNKITGITASVGGFFGSSYEVDIDFPSGNVAWRRQFGDSVSDEKKKIPPEAIEQFVEALKWLDFLNWKAKYVEPYVLDGTQWSIEIRREGRTLRKYGSNKYPKAWGDFCNLLETLTGRRFR